MVLVRMLESVLVIWGHAGYVLAWTWIWDLGWQVQEWVRVVRIVKVEFWGVAVVVGKLHLMIMMEKGCLVLVCSVPLSACQGKVLRLVGMVLVVVPV